VKKEYVYPDMKDKITTALINEKEPYKSYWQKSERHVLNLMKRYVEERIENKDAWFIDAGCGDGKLLQEFEKYFGRIVAIDPDVNRLKLAEDIVEKQGFSEKVYFKAVSIEYLDVKEQSDVILCSHILQHVPTDSIPLILEKFSHILKRTGLLFITTCHSTKGYDYFAEDFLKNSEFIEEIITKNEFNSLAFNANGGLPIHFFSRKNITHLLESFGFKIIDFKTFHIVEKNLCLDKIFNRDEIVNFFPFLQARKGRDMFIVAKLYNER
jgi:2-polyprenyl-3-methyl-5-hydroxy-6-metoxy-1,4-benzoquinol methylase